MITEIFRNLSFDEIKRYSDLISDYNTYYAYTHFAMVKQDATKYNLENEKLKQVELQLKAFLTEIHNKHARSKV